MKEINVKEHFAAQADSYIELMEKLVPNYLDGQETMIDLIQCDVNKPIKVLDLGCGNGILSQLVFKKFPNAKIVGFDITKEMLDTYVNKLEKHKDKFEVIQGDFKTNDFGKNYDVVLTGLTLQHLNPNERKEIFQKIFNSLNKNGIYITRDIIVSHNKKETKNLYDQWIKYMNSCSEDGNIWYDKHIQKDFPQTVNDLVSWQQEVGFKNVKVEIQNINFAILSASKNT